MTSKTEDLTIPADGDVRPDFQTLDDDQLDQYIEDFGKRFDSFTYKNTSSGDMFETFIEWKNGDNPPITIRGTNFTELTAKRTAISEAFIRRNEV